MCASLFRTTEAEEKRREERKKEKQLKQQERAQRRKEQEESEWTEVSRGGAQVVMVSSFLHNTIHVKILFYMYCVL